MNLFNRHTHKLWASAAAISSFLLAGCGGGGGNPGPVSTPAPTATPMPIPTATPTPTPIITSPKLIIAPIINSDSANLVLSPVDLNKGIFAYHTVSNTRTLSDGVVHVVQGGSEIANSQNLNFAALGINTSINPRLLRDPAIGNVMACMGRENDNSYFRVVITDLDNKNSFVIGPDNSNPTFKNTVAPIFGASLHYEDPFLFSANGKLYLLCKQRSKLPGTNGLCLFDVDRTAKSATLIAQITDNGAELSMPIVGTNNELICQKVLDGNGGRAIVAYSMLDILQNALAASDQPYQHTAAGTVLSTGTNLYLPQPTFDGLLQMMPDSTRHDKVYYQRFNEQSMEQLPLGAASSDYSDAYPLYSDNLNLIIAYSVDDGKGYKAFMGILTRADKNTDWQLLLAEPLPFSGTNILGATFRKVNTDTQKPGAVLHSMHALTP